MVENAKLENTLSSSSSSTRSELENKLSEIYFDPKDEGSFGGVERLYKRAKELRLKGLSRKRVKEFLSGERVYSLHRPARKKFPRNPTYVQGVDDQWQADLVDVHTLSRINSGHNYILTVIDVFSKHAWAEPVRTKSGKDIADAFIRILKNASPRRPRRVQTDKGREFLNSNVVGLMKNEGIKLFTSNSDQKASVVERFNRTLKSRMWRYFTSKQTHRYLEVLPNLINSYNNSFHRSIGMSPSQVRRDDPKQEKLIAGRLWGGLRRVRRRRARGGRAAAAPGAAAAGPPTPNAAHSEAASGGRRRRVRSPSANEKIKALSSTSNPEALAVGNMVRISRGKNTFEKGYEANWSDEHFRIREVIQPISSSSSSSVGESHSPRNSTVYKLEEESGEPISGTFYKHELQPIPQNQFIIERILRSRASPSINKEKEFLVKWLGWPTKYNTWVPASDLYKIKN